MMAQNLKRDFITGLDLGQVKDFTAVAVLERSIRPDVLLPGRNVSHYVVRHLERMPLGTPYPDIWSKLIKQFAAPALANSTLAVDQTGVGRPVVDMLRRSGIRARIVPITITGGHKPNLDSTGRWLVPKRDLVDTLQVLLQSRRLKIPRQLSQASTLVQELLNFQVKITASANETFGTWREGQHDDLVLAIAIAAWEAERKGTVMPSPPFVINSPAPLPRPW